MAFKWVAKSLVQKTLSYLPGGICINAAISERVFHNLPPRWSQKIGYALKHLRMLRGCEVSALPKTTWLEVGPGWAPLSAVVFYLAGVENHWLYDKHRHFQARYISLRGLEPYLEQVAAASGCDVTAVYRRYGRIRAVTDLSLLELCNIVYHAPADAAQTGLPSGSVDVVTTTLVLEHIPRGVLKQFLCEWRRILRPGGLMSHTIDLSDHYAHQDRSISSVNFLKFRPRVWNFFCNRITYCNRLRERDYLTMFSDEGFEILYLDSKTDPGALRALASMSVAAEFREMSPRELAVTESYIVAQKVQ